jgi:N-acetylmuramoyl-L-alanine amidase
LSKYKESLSMKKMTAFFCALALAAGCVLPAFASTVLPPEAASVQAAAPDRVTVRFYDEQEGRYGEDQSVEVVNVTLDGEAMDLDLPALARTVDGVDSRTLVPVRPIAEALGASVLWMGENRQVLISTETDTIVLTLGSATAVVNGESVELPGGVPADVARCGETERTLVPLRFVSEQLHATVDWDNDTYTAQVTSPAEPEPEPEPTPTPTPTQTPAAVPNGFLLRITSDDKAETITLYLNKTPNYKVKDYGDRVVIDLLGFALGSGQDGSQTVENPVIDQVRYAQHGTDLYSDYAYTTRVVLDLAEGCTYADNVTVTGDPNLLAVVVTVRSNQTGAELPTGPGENWDPNAFTVALDAGHGGSASGAVYENVMEKTITLPITLRVAELLEEKGYNVVLTRSEDVYMDLYDRCTVANNMGADIFVSIHANASGSNTAYQGIYTYSFPESQRGAALAKCIQSAVVKSTGGVDRGLLTNNYVVLRETEMPAALLETGFMSCHEELMRLIDPDYQEKLAQGVARGVENYLATLPAKTAAAS